MKNSLQQRDSFIDPKKDSDSKNEVRYLIIVILIIVYDEEETSEFLKQLKIVKGEENGD